MKRFFQRKLTLLLLHILFMTSSTGAVRLTEPPDLSWSPIIFYKLCSTSIHNWNWQDSAHNFHFDLSDQDKFWLQNESCMTGTKYYINKAAIYKAFYEFYKKRGTFYSSFRPQALESVKSIFSTKFSLSSNLFL